MAGACSRVHDVSRACVCMCAYVCSTGAVLGFDNHPSPLSQEESMARPICLDEVAADSYTLQCGHSFHSKCMLTSVLSGHQRCPICRVSCVQVASTDHGSDEDSDERGDEDSVERQREINRQSERESHKRMDKAIRIGLRQVKKGVATSQVLDAVRRYKRLTTERDRLVRDERRSRRAAVAYAEALRSATAALNQTSTVQRLVSVTIRVDRHSQVCHNAKFEADFARLDIAAAAGIEPAPPVAWGRVWSSPYE